MVARALSGDAFKVAIRGLRHLLLGYLLIGFGLTTVQSAGSTTKSGSTTGSGAAGTPGRSTTSGGPHYGCRWDVAGTIACLSSRLIACVETHLRVLSGRAREDHTRRRDRWAGLPTARGTDCERCWDHWEIRRLTGPQHSSGPAIRTATHSANIRFIVNASSTLTSEDAHRQARVPNRQLTLETNEGAGCDDVEIVKLQRVRCRRVSGGSGQQRHLGRAVAIIEIEF